MTASSSCVRVAVRVRPLTENEKQHHRNNAIEFMPNNRQQIVLGGDRPFTFDYVYPPSVDQNEVYSTCVIPLLNKFMEGYNSTILAYGQTGSGKTYSMGIGLDAVKNLSASESGIVPRFIDSLFKGLDAKQQSLNYSYQVCVSFLELHNEDLVDLLCPNVKRREGLNLTIREDSHGNICWSGVREEVVTGPHELMGLLQKGSIARTTASTDMNNTSSRSHAIFSVILKQFISDQIPENKDSDHNLTRSPSDQTLVSPTVSTEQMQTKKLVSKFHFVDLAGSERLKRTNAVGDRAKEGISINTGLLALGNVISALGDESRRVSHIPYRDSKLTRLLQDSLGGNSQTLMLACASPAESNITETLNTLKYANRARNIRNRVVINQEINESERLKATIARLKEELRGTDDFLHAVNDEMDALKSQVSSLQHALHQTAAELANANYERDTYRCQLQIQDGTDQDIEMKQVPSALLKEYTNTIESLKAELLQSQQLLKQQQEQRQAVSLVDQTKSVLQVDHIDSSATLVGSPVQHPADATNEKPSQQFPRLQPEISERSDRKKKKHSYRFGSKRSKTIRRKSITSSTTSSHSILPKQGKSTAESILKRNPILLEAKKSIQKETEFLQSAKISMAHQDPSNIWNLESKLNHSGEQLPKSLQYRRRTVDIIPPTIPVATVIQNDLVAENKRLLQKLSTLIESKHTIIRQLEKSEKLRAEQTKQLSRKVADVNSKKTNATSQYKRELSDLRNQYESRIKKLQVDQQMLRRKHMQLITKSDSMRNQNQSVMDGLNRTIDKLSHEKKKMIKRLKMESDRAKEKLMESERELAKVKRQEAQLVSTKKRLERELMLQKSASKRATEEIVALSGQMKQIAAIIKKVMSNNGKQAPNSAITDRNLLAKAAACANVRGYLVKQNAIKKTGGKFKVTSLQQHVYQKKRLIHRAISLYVQGQSKAKLGEELAQKRDRLIEEQKELLAERQLVLEEEWRCGNLSHGEDAPQYMDERIDLITLQVDTLNQQINSMLLQQKYDLEDDDHWMDVIDRELQIGILDNTDSQVAYEIALSLIRSLEPEEARLVSEALMEDIILLKTDQQTSTSSLRHLNAMLYSMQTGLVQMRRAGVCNSSGDRRKSLPQSFMKGISPLDCVFMKVLQSPVDIRCGLVLPKLNEMRIQYN